MAAPGRVSHVYIMRSGVSNVFKVGVSVNPHSRVAQLQTGCPETITLVDSTPCTAGIDAYAAEATIHAYLKEQGMHARGE